MGNTSKYHYEYDVINVGMCYGGARSGHYRTYQEARDAAAAERCWGNRGSAWWIRKTRVYER